MKAVPSDRHWQPLAGQCKETGFVFYVQIYEDRGHEFAGFELSPSSYPRLLELVEEGRVAATDGLLKKARAHISKSGST